MQLIYSQLIFLLLPKYFFVYFIVKLSFCIFISAKTYERYRTNAVIDSYDLPFVSRRYVKNYEIEQ